MILKERLGELNMILKEQLGELNLILKVRRVEHDIKS